MARFDRDRRADLRDDIAGARAGPTEPPLLTTPRRALWSAASMVGIVAIMFAVFYGINAQRSPDNRPASAAITTPSQDQTTGQR
jgi:hypothetical protein